MRTKNCRLDRFCPPGMLPEDGICLRLHTGIGAGPLTAVFVGGIEGKWEYYVAGNAVDQMAKVLHLFVRTNSIDVSPIFFYTRARSYSRLATIVHRGKLFFRQRRTRFCRVQSLTSEPLWSFHLMNFHHKSLQALI